MPRRISGTLTGKDFTLSPGETWVLDGDVEVRASGDIWLLGDIVCDARSAPGAGIKLRTAKGDILIAGRIATATGADGDSPPVAPSVRAGDGRAGGAIDVSAGGRLVLLESARLRSGAGGAGGRAEARGFGPAHALVKALSGAGGPGGTIRLSAGDVMILEGEIRAGFGGWGGEALAIGAPAGVPGEDGRPKDQKPKGEKKNQAPRPGPAVVEATAKGGGAGGDLLLATGSAGGVIKLAGVLAAGAGGHSFKATARGGRRSTALLEPGGRGGNVSIRLHEAPPAIDQAKTCTICPGTGGDSGDRSITVDPDEPPRLFFDGAEAEATHDALAKVGHPADPPDAGGGAAGTVTAVAVWPGSPPIEEAIALRIEPAAAGSTTASIAIVAGKRERDETGSSARGAVPGAATRAELP